MNLKIKRLRPGAHTPGRATAGSAGVDLRACIDEKGITLAPLERALIPTGFAVELPGQDMVALVFARSGLALKQGLAMANGVGVIDADYRGEVGVPVVNLSDAPIHIANGDRIAQMLFMRVERPEMIEFGELSETGRGAGGFGSTGVE